MPDVLDILNWKRRKGSPYPGASLPPGLISDADGPTGQGSLIDDTDSGSGTPLDLSSDNAGPSLPPGAVPPNKANQADTDRPPTLPNGPIPEGMTSSEEPEPSPDSDESAPPQRLLLRDALNPGTPVPPAPRQTLRSAIGQGTQQRAGSGQSQIDVDALMRQIIQGGMAPPPHAAPPKTWRQIAAGVTAGLGGGIGQSLAPLVEYGSKGLEQERTRAEWDKDQAQKQQIAERLIAYQREKNVHDDNVTRAAALKLSQDQLAQGRHDTNVDTFLKGGNEMHPNLGGTFSAGPMSINANVLPPDTTPPTGMPPTQSDDHMLPSTPPPSMLGVANLPRPAGPQPFKTPAQFEGSQQPSAAGPGPITLPAPPRIATRNTLKMPASQVSASGIVDPGPGRYEMASQPLDDPGFKRVAVSKPQQLKEAYDIKHQDDIVVPQDITDMFGLVPNTKVPPAQLAQFITDQTNRMKEENIPDEQKFKNRQKIAKYLEDSGNPLDKRDLAVFLATGKIERPQNISLTAGVTQDRLEYDARSKELAALQKPLDDTTTRFSKLFDTIAQGNATADTLIAPEMIVAMAGGLNSGMRINETEIDRNTQGQGWWGEIVRKARRVIAGTGESWQLLPIERQQTVKLAQLAFAKIQAKKALINQANQDLLEVSDATGRRRIVVELKKALTDIDEKGIQTDLNQIGGKSKPGGGKGDPTGGYVPGHIYPLPGGAKKVFEGGDYRDGANWSEPSTKAVTGPTPAQGQPTPAAAPAAQPPTPAPPPPQVLQGVKEGGTMTSPDGSKWKKVNGQPIMTAPPPQPKSK